MLAFLDRHPGEVRFYLFRAIDRFTRGGVLTYARMKEELAERGVELVDSMGVIQPIRNTLEHTGFEYEWSRISPSAIAEVVMATTANLEVNTILTRLIGQEINLTKQGYKIRPPQDGFKNERIYVGEKRRTILVPDPERAKYLVAMFELRAAGQLTDVEIVRRVNAMGYRRRTFKRWSPGKAKVTGHGGGGGLLTVSRFQEIIRRPVYCGIVWEKWTNWLPVKAAYNGLVSVETWNAANRGKRYIRTTPTGWDLLHDFDPDRVGSVHTRNNPDFPFKSVILCSSCRKPFMGSASRGRSGQRFPAYHCDRSHPRVARNKASFENAVKTYIDSLIFHPDVIAAAVQALLYQYERREEELRTSAGEMERAIAGLKIEQAETVSAFKAATSDVLRRALEVDIERLEADIARAAVQRDDAEISEADLQAYIANMVEIMEHPAILLETPADTHAQRARYMRTFEALPTLMEIESGTAKLTPIFSVCEGQADRESVWVRLRGLTWNQIRSEILRHEISDTNKVKPTQRRISAPTWIDVKPNFWSASFKSKS